MSRPARATHGDYGYARKHKCPCDPCYKAKSQYAKRRTFERYNGVEARIDATHLREKLLGFLDDGAQLMQITRAAGLVESQTKNILWGRNGKPPAPWVYRPTAAKIEAITYEDCMAIPTLVDAIGVHRRINALQALGHGIRQIADAIGVSETMIYQYLKSERCITTTVEAVHRAYEEMSIHEGTCQRTLWRHRRLNTPTPMCWEDHELDDRNAKPRARRCVVNRCGREASRASLCDSHYNDAAKMGAFSSPHKGRYREVVVYLSKRKNTQDATMYDSILECLELGLSYNETAIRLSVSRDLVDKVVKKERLRVG